MALALVGIVIATPVLNTTYAMENTSTTALTRAQRDDITINTLEDSDEQRIVEVTEVDKVYLSVFNKKYNTLSYEVKSDGEIIESKSIDMSNTENTENLQIEARATESLGCIYSKLRYSINMKSWTITNSKGSVKKKPETVSHKDYLYKFRDAVKASRRYENAARLAMDSAQISIIMASITSATGVGFIVSAVTAVGGSLGAAYNIWDSIVERREADRYFALL